MSERDCFVIMPFGEKTDADGRSINFDAIYKHIIKATVENLGISCTRCDEIAEAGWIHSKMFQQIYRSAIAIVDITSLNPNVFYELGVRHALAESVTVIIRRRGTKLPFNIQDFQVIDYDQEDLDSVEEAKKKIADFISNGLKLKKKDSPVYNVLDLRINSEPIKIDMLDVFAYKLREVHDKEIRLVTGDLQNIRNMADIWVSSENTNMQMSRHYERSVSGVIRYLGAKRNPYTGQVVEDTIAKKLLEVVGENASVAPGTIVPTAAGELYQTHGVKIIFHAASVFGQVGEGYRPIPDIGTCVSNALAMIDSKEFKDSGFKSILFPLMGCGTGRGALEENARKLIGAAISYLDANQHSTIDKVYFLTWSDNELATCQRILQEAAAVTVALPT